MNFPPVLVSSNPKLKHNNMLEELNDNLQHADGQEQTASIENNSTVEVENEIEIQEPEVTENETVSQDLEVNTPVPDANGTVRTDTLNISFISPATPATSIPKNNCWSNSEPLK